jgi:hypothetical protein
MGLAERLRGLQRQVAEVKRQMALGRGGTAGAGPEGIEEGAGEVATLKARRPVARQVDSETIGPPTA